MNPLGFVLPAATIGLGSLLLKPQRGFFIPLPEDQSGPPEPFQNQPQIVLEEMHDDEIVITDHPVEKGAQIADHFYKKPSELTIRCAWSNSPSSSGSLMGKAVGAASAVGGPIVRIAAAAGSTISAVQSLLSGSAANQVNAIYQKLLALQISGVPFDIYTGKRVYTDMLFRSLHVHTDANTENSLLLTARCRQVLIATTTVTNTSVNNSALADQKNSSAVNQGALSTKPASGIEVPTP
jgi:hypothetical protein